MPSDNLRERGSRHNKREVLATYTEPDGERIAIIGTIAARAIAVLARANGSGYDGLVHARKAVGHIRCATTAKAWDSRPQASALVQPEAAMSFTTETGQSRSVFRFRMRKVRHKRV